MGELEATAEKKVAARGEPPRTRVRVRAHNGSSVKLDQEYSRLKKEIQAYRSLKSKGVSDEMLLRWEKVMARAGMTPGAVQRELSKNGNLSELEARMQSRVEKARKTLDSTVERNADLRKKYSASWDSMTRYQLLREMGVDGSVLKRWERLVVGNGVDPEKLEDELVELKNLSGTKKELEENLVTVKAELDAADGRLKAVGGELANLEAQRSELLRTVDEMSRHFKETLRVMAEGAAGELKEVQARAGEEIQRAAAGAQSNLNASLVSATTAVDEFKAKVEAAYEAAFQTGEAIGRTEALKPLVKFLETGEGKPGEVIPLMTILAHTFAKWAQGSDPALAEKAREYGEYLNGKLRGA